MKWPVLGSRFVFQQLGEELGDEPTHTLALLAATPSELTQHRGVDIHDGSRHDAVTLTGTQLMSGASRPGAEVVDRALRALKYGFHTQARFGRV